MNLYITINDTCNLIDACYEMIVKLHIRDFVIMGLIDKAALVAEIEKLIRKDKYSTEYVNGKKYAFKKILSLIDTLKVKEVDEHKEMMSECPYRQVGCAMYEGKILECNGTCGWVVDHLNLKCKKENKL